MLGPDGYGTWFALFVAVAVMLILTVGLSLLAASVTAQGKAIPTAWHVLRLPATLLLRTFFLWGATILATAAFCDLFSQDGAAPAHQLFANKECTESPHIILLLLSFPVLLLHLGAGTVARVGDSGMNPVGMELTAGPTATPFVRTTAVTGAFAVCSVWLRALPQTLGVVGVAAFLYTFFLHVRHAPYAHRWVGYLHAGAHAMMLYISLCLLALGSSGAGRAELITTAMVAGAPVFLLAGAAAMWWRVHSLDRVARTILPAALDLLAREGSSPDLGVIGKGEDNEADPLDFSHVFASPLDVEIAARCCARRDAYGNLEDHWVLVADSIYRHGISEFPQSGALMMHYSNFLHFVQHDSVNSIAHLTKASKGSSGTVLRYVFYVRDRWHRLASASSGFGGDGAMDLLSYVEFQHQYKGVQRGHTQVLKMGRTFWRQLLRKDLKFRHLARVVVYLREAQDGANTIYRAMLERYPKNVKLIRSYGMFLEEVQNDPWKAVRYSDEAEKLEDMQNEARKDAMLGNLGGEDVSPTMNVDDNVDAVVVINDTGIVQMTNRLANKLFGYKMGELEGMNVSILMPQPFSGQHNGYLRNYKVSGRPRVLNTLRTVVGIHKDKHVFAVSLLVTKVEQAGTTTFMGVLHRIEENLTHGVVWLNLQGVVLCANRGFTDNFGYSTTDITNKPISSCAPAESRWEEEISTIEERLQSMFEQIQAIKAKMLEEEQNDPELAARRERERRAGRVPVIPLEKEAEETRFKFADRIKHKYSKNVIGVDCEVALGGTEAVRILEITLTPTDEGQGVLAFDLTGNLTYVNKLVEGMLGYTVGHMMNKGFKMDKVLTTPYSTFHARLLKGMFQKGEQPALDVPCYNGHVVALAGKGNKPIPVRLRWWPQRDGNSIAFVSIVQPVDPCREATAWGLSPTDAVSHISRAICLNVLLLRDGTVAGVGNGVAFHKKGVPGEVFGFEAEEMIGASLGDYIDVLGAVVTNAKKYANVTAEEVLEPFLHNLSQKCLELQTSFRASILCADPVDSSNVERVPVRMTLKPLQATRVDINSLAQLGRVEANYVPRMAEMGEGYLVELWSANWLNGDVTTSKDLVIRSVGHHTALLTGMPAKSLVGRSLASVLAGGETALGALKKTLKEGASRVPVDLVHLDSSTMNSSVTGSQRMVGRKEVHLLLRGVFEEPTSDMEALRRIEGLLAMEGDKNAASMAAASKKKAARVSFSAAVHAAEDDKAADKEEADKEADKEDNDDDEERSKSGSEDEDEHERNEKVNETAANAAPGKGGVEDDAQSVGESALGSDASSFHGTHSTDFKKAKRHKRLARLLEHAPVSVLARQLHLKSLTLVFLTGALHVLFFALAVSLVQSSSDMATTARNAGKALWEIELVATNMRVLQSFGKGGLWSRLKADALDEIQEDIRKLAGEYEDVFEGVYIESQIVAGKTQAPAAMRSAGSVNQDREKEIIFREPLIEVAVHQEVDGADVVEQRKMGLFELSEEYVQRTLLTSEEFEHPPRDSYREELDIDRKWLFVMENTHVAVIPALTEMLGAAETEAGMQNDYVSRDLLLITVFQALLIIPATSLAVYWLMSELNRARTSLFSIFLHVPRPVVLSLATKPLSDGDHEVDDEDDDNFAGTISRSDGRMAALARRGSSRACAWNMAPDRQLDLKGQRSWLLALPILALAAVSFALHMVAYSLFIQSKQPLRELVLAEVIQGKIGYMRFLANELVLAEEPSERELNDKLRADLDGVVIETQLMWDALLFGDPEFNTTGRFTYSTPASQKLLFDDGCLRINMPCFEEGHQFYTATTGGLDQLFRQFVSRADLLVSAPYYDESDIENTLSPFNAHFEFLWETAETDVRGGLKRMMDMLDRDVFKVITDVIVIESILFVVTMCVTAAYAFVTVPPVRVAENEVEMAADLLCQLPEAMKAEDKAQELLDIQDTSAALHSSETLGRVILRRVGDAIARVVLGRRFKFLLDLETKYLAEKAAAARERELEEKKKLLT